MQKVLWVSMVLCRTTYFTKEPLIHLFKESRFLVRLSVLSVLCVFSLTRQEQQLHTQTQTRGWVSPQRLEPREGKGVDILQMLTKARDEYDKVAHTQTPVHACARVACHHQRALLVHCNSAHSQHRQRFSIHNSAPQTGLKTEVYAFLYYYLWILTLNITQVCPHRPRVLWRSYGGVWAWVPSVPLVGSAVMWLIYLVCKLEISSVIFV